MSNTQESSQPRRVSLVVDEYPPLRRRYSCPTLGCDTASIPEATSSANSSIVGQGSYPMMGSLVYFKRKKDHTDSAISDETDDEQSTESCSTGIGDRLASFSIKERSGSDISSVENSQAPDPLKYEESDCQWSPEEEAGMTTDSFNDIDDKINRDRSSNVEWFDRSVLNEKRKHHHHHKHHDGGEKKDRDHSRRLTCAVIFTKPHVVEI